MLKGPVEIFNGNKIQSSVNGTPVVFANDIVVSGSIDLTGTIDGIDLSSLSSSLNTRIGSIESTTSLLNEFTSSASGRLGVIETSTGSLNSFTNSINTTIKSKLDADSVVSGSSQIILSGTTGFSVVSASLSSLSSSISITNFNQDGRLTSIENKTGSYATTGSNNFVGNQTITGSLVITQNLQVLGSSSVIYATSSQLIVEDNVIILNASTPAERFAGIQVYDSGSNGEVTASLFWDGLHNRWIYQNSSDSHYGGAMFIAGPRNTGSLGDEVTLTSGKLPKSIGGDHIGDSIVTETNGGIGISGSLVITGSILSTVTPLVSGSSQITYSGLTGIPSGIISGSSQVVSSLPSGTVSGSSQVLNGTTIHSGSFFNGITVVSGSAQISFNGITDKPTLVSGSSQISYPSLSNIPGGLVSGSSQIDLTLTTNYSSGIKTRLNAEGVISGSSQVTGIANSQLTNSSFHVGTTSISLGRVSASQTLTGVSIDGNATSETLATVTARGNTANNKIIINSTGVGGDATLKINTSTSSTFVHSQENLAANLTAGQHNISVIGRTANTKNSGYIGYYWAGDASNSNFVTIGHWGNDDLFRIYGDGVVSVGTNTVWHAGNLTNLNQLTNGPGFITSYTETDTLASVTARGASTSTAISINNNLTVTGGRVLAQSGGANTYGLFSGYDNNNHMMTFRAAIAGSTSSPTITAGHQTTFIEYAESNDTTGWFFKSASTGTYQEIARITRTGINWNGNTVYHTGNIPTWNQNTTGTASNITSYTINQSVGTGNNVTFNYLKLNAATGGSTSVNGVVALKIGGLSDYDSFDLGINNNYDAMIRTYGNDLKYYSGHWRTVGSVSSEDHSHYWYTSKNGSANWSTAKLRLDHDGHLTPGFNGTQNLGSSSLRWNTVFTSDLSLSNGIGDYTIVEGENDLFLYNNKQNKVYKFMLQEVNPNDATPKRPE
jgi:hypothetical protein